MSTTITFTIDDREIVGQRGQTILQAAEAVGIYIPRLCASKDLAPHGSCRICTVLVNGRPQSACTQPIAEGMMVENDTEAVRELRKSIVEMLLVEGNHFCMFCEKSGNCELQALAYRYGITAPRYPYMFPKREIDCTHDDVFVDHNRCVLCGRCVQTSKTKDGKNIFQFVGRGIHKRVGVDSADGLGETELKATDKAVDACPVGALMRKRVGFSRPVGQREYDHEPIGSDIEAKSTN